MLELGAVGFAELVANEACPEIADGPGQVVTATFAHTSAQVLDLVFEPMDAWTADSRILASPETRQAFRSTADHDSSSSSLTLGVTAAHQFWSMTRDEFVPAGEMELGEQVVALEGQLWRLTSITSRAGPESVYNFEVAGEHVYYVGSDGLLVHNAYITQALRHAGGKVGKLLGKSPSGTIAKRAGQKLAGDHVLPLEAIRIALKNAGVVQGSPAWKWAINWANNPQNLRAMNSALNSSKGARNAVAWSRTPLGSLVPRKYIQNVLRKQYTNAHKLSKDFAEEFKERGKLDFSFFFR